MERKDLKELYRNFICRCVVTPEDKEENKHLDARYEEAIEWLRTTPRYFLSDAVITLNWNYLISITGIYNDQWSVVVAEKYGEDGGRIWIECDQVEDGLAELVLWARDTFQSSEEI